MIGRPEYTLSLPPPCPTNRDHLRTNVPARPEPARGSYRDNHARQTAESLAPAPRRIPPDG